MILMIDNYDSFTYNLVQYLRELGAEVEVHRNDAITLEEIDKKVPAGIVLSPGPCTPAKAGVSVSVVKEFAPRIPMLGVCLGHQSIGAALGGDIIRASRIMHGKVSNIHHEGVGVFQGLSAPFEATRYHSLVIDRETLPEELEVTAWTEGEGDEEIMGIRHREWPLEGVQFHPESILTLEGKALLQNFLDRVPGAST
ncbi:MAG: aminodeoxychorismate/anthranilate synthase component II [Candidatus Binatia bacterium]|nr:aminodeoxychorismate/anthranilate synthase component II [Candidatus Binatia bacterium]